MKTIEERINEVRTYLKEHGYDTFLRERFMGQYRIDIMRHGTDYYLKMKNGSTYWLTEESYKKLKDCVAL